MTPPIKKPNAAQLRLLAVIEILSGHEVAGLRLTDVAEALAQAGYQATASTVLHDLEALRDGGWAQQMTERANKNWRLVAKPIQLLTNVQWGLQSAGLRLNEVQQWIGLATRSRPG